MAGSRLATTALIWMTLVAAGGCTTVRVFPADAIDPLRSQLEPGDEVSLTLRDGRTVAGEVASASPSVLAVLAPDGSRVDVGWSDIERLEQREFSGAKTTGLVVGTLAAVSLIVAAIVKDGFEDVLATD